MERTLTVARPEGLHARPAAQFVALASGFASRTTVRRNGASADAASILEVLSLDVRSGDEITIESYGEDEAEALEALTAFVGAPRARVLHGIGASRGIGVAPAWIHRVEPLQIPEGPVVDGEAEADRATEALAAVAAELRALADSSPGGGDEILRAQAAIAEDPVLGRSAASSARGGVHAARALVDAGAHQASHLEGGDGFLAARAADVREVCDRAARKVLGMPSPQLEGPDQPAVVVARDLLPADTMALDPRKVRAFVTESGSPTSHTSILARSLQVPAVVAVHGLLEAVQNGAPLAVDGDSGAVHLEPDRELLEELAEREAQRRRQRHELRQRFAENAAATSDGLRVELAANVRNVDEVQVAIQAGAEGVGLFRTELFVLDRRRPPTEDEQFDVLAAMCGLLGDRRLVVRTFDIGADKPVAFLPRRDERNPELGVRGIRLAMRHPELLDTQVRAVVRAARDGGRLAVMAPMVATVEEARWFVERVDRAGGRDAGIEVGVMVEVPSAALMADQIAAHVDFLSIGTNDLTQYLHAADRRLGDLVELHDPFAPAVLRAVQLTCDGATASDAWVGVCGEAASNPDWAVLAVGLGVTELSMQAASILDVRLAIAERTLDDCREAAHAALARQGAPR